MIYVSLVLFLFFCLFLMPSFIFFFFFNDTATTEISTLSLHDALPILLRQDHGEPRTRHNAQGPGARHYAQHLNMRLHPSCRDRVGERPSMKSLCLASDAEFGTCSCGFGMTLQEDSQCPYHRSEVATSVQHAGVCDAQSRIRIASRWRKRLRIDAVGNTREVYGWVPRHQGLQELGGVRDAPVGGAKGETLKPAGQGVEGPAPENAMSPPRRRPGASPRTPQATEPAHSPPDGSQARREVGGVR